MKNVIEQSFKGVTSTSKRKYACRAQRRHAYFADALVASLLRTRNVLATLKHRQVFRCACWVRSASLLLSRRFGHNTAHRQRSSQLMRVKHNFPIYGKRLCFYPACNSIVPARVRQSEATRTLNALTTSFLSSAIAVSSLSILLTAVLTLALTSWQGSYIAGQSPSCPRLTT